MRAIGFCGLGLAGAAAMAVVLGAPAVASDEGKSGQDGAAEARLERVLDEAMDEEPFLTDEEQALIERKCGYAPGTSGGKNLTISDGVLHCSNGRRVDDAEVRAMMAKAGPRIEKQVERIMARPEIKQAIEAVASEASQKALRELAEKWD